MIVEDEPLIAMLLADEVEALEGEVVGMLDSVADALTLLDEHDVAAAIMDANLTDRDITPVALRLLDASIPFVLYTGTGLPPGLCDRSAEITVVMKPGRPADKLMELIDQLRQ